MGFIFFLTADTPTDYLLNPSVPSQAQDSGVGEEAVPPTLE